MTRICRVYDACSAFSDARKNQRYCLISGYVVADIAAAREPGKYLVIAAYPVCNRTGSFNCYIGRVNYRAFLFGIQQVA